MTALEVSFVVAGRVQGAGKRQLLSSGPCAGHGAPRPGQEPFGARTPGAKLKHVWLQQGLVLLGAG